jgi:hypothetical protein
VLGRQGSWLDFFSDFSLRLIFIFLGWAMNVSEDRLGWWMYVATYTAFWFGLVGRNGRDWGDECMVRPCWKPIEAELKATGSFAWARVSSYL